MRRKIFWKNYSRNKKISPKRKNHPQEKILPKVEEDPNHKEYPPLSVPKRNQNKSKNLRKNKKY